MTEINNRIEEVAKLLFKRDCPSGDWDFAVPAQKEKWLKDARQICQLFPQPLNGVRLLTEDDAETKSAVRLLVEEGHQSHTTVAFLRGAKVQLARLSRPLDDEGLEEALNNYFANDYYGMAYKDLREDLRHMVDMVTAFVLALLQPKIEEARRQGEDRIIKWVEDTDILIMLSLKKREGWQALKGGKHQQNKSIFRTRCSPF